MKIFVDTIKQHFYSMDYFEMEEETFEFEYKDGRLHQIGTNWYMDCRNMTDVFEKITKKFRNTGYQIQDIQRGYE